MMLKKTFYLILLALALMPLQVIFTTDALADSTQVFAPNSPSNPQIDSSKFQTMNKNLTLFYFTFASTVNPQGYYSYNLCPSGGLFINGSIFQLPSFPGLPTPVWGQVYMWQCMVPLGIWTKYLSPNPAIINSNFIDITGLDISTLSNLTNALSQNYPGSWEWYQSPSLPSNSTKYTAYQYPNNAYIPAAAGGSGLGCGAAGGYSNVKCWSGGVEIRVDRTGDGKFFFYLAPNQNASCNIHRDYGPTPAKCPGGGCPCDGSFTIKPGQAWVGACCFGTWKSSVTNLSDPSFNTCGGGCQ